MSHTKEPTFQKMEVHLRVKVANNCCKCVWCTTHTLSLTRTPYTLSLTHCTFSLLHTLSLSFSLTHIHTRLHMQWCTHTQWHTQLLSIHTQFLSLSLSHTHVYTCTHTHTQIISTHTKNESSLIIHTILSIPVLLLLTAEPVRAHVVLGDVETRRFEHTLLRYGMHVYRQRFAFAWNCFKANIGDTSERWKRTKTYSPIDNDERKDKKHSSFDNEMSSSGR